MKREKYRIKAAVLLSLIAALMALVPRQALAQLPEPVVAIHVSELTKALETMPATPPTPPAGPDATGYEWTHTAWHYFVAYESLKEALRSDGTPFVEISDADIISGNLLQADGTPRYPIVISLASEAVDDAEIAPLRSYVNSGGFLFIGSSAFTRNPDGTMRGDFALAAEMGVHGVASSIDNWGVNMKFTKLIDHPLVVNVPTGNLNWRMPLTSDEIPNEGIDPDAIIHGNHYYWQVSVTDATVIATGALHPLLTVKNYGKGTFIYHSVFQPLIGHGGFDSGIYAYTLFRNAIAMAFQSANIPIIRLSPWHFQYDAAFIVRHDFENESDLIRSIENSAAFESSVGARGDYYFCTGTLRDHMADKATIITSLRRAVANYGASIGSHNGGLNNPAYPFMEPLAYDYWHWGPDDVLDVSPAGYASGKAYAEASIAKSYEDIEGWLTGVDNGRSGCGAAGTCPRIWVSPKFNSTREDSYALLDSLGTVTTGEQQVGPFPHWTVSTQTDGKRYNHLTLPVSDWYVGSDVLQTLDSLNSSSMRAAVDFYYGLGALINLYGHRESRPGSVQGEYVSYCIAKPRIWSTNTVGVHDWWRLRSNVSVTPGYSIIGDTAVATATIAGATDTNTAVEIAIPGWDSQVAGSLQVFLNGSFTPADNYRITNSGVKVRVGASASDLEVRFQIAISPPFSFSIWKNAPIPAVIADPVTGAGEVGVKFRSDVDGYITGIRFYKAATNTGTHIGSLWSSTGERLASATFTNETASGWQQVLFSTPVAITANTVYIASYHLNVGHYSCDTNYFTAGVDNPPLHALADGVSGVNGVGAPGATSTFPNQGWMKSNFWVDVVFSTSATVDTTPPTVMSFTIPAIADSLTVPITGFTATDNVGVTGYLVTESATAPTPTAAGWSATPQTSYTFATGGSKILYAWAKDAADNVSASKSAAVTITLAGPTALSIWSNSAVPAVAADPDTGAGEAGVKFRSDVDGYITGIRFYKASTNTGTHIGSLWTSTGERLASATFANETASGWQQVAFSTPVAITANTVYVASYHFNVGHYSCDPNYFTVGVDNPPLHALADGVSGQNGVGVSDSTITFPNLGWQKSNYWVDVVFTPLE